MNRSAWVGIMVSALGMVAAAPEEPRPTVAVRMAKPRYVEGEPIEIVVTVSNPATRPAEFAFSYPGAFLRDVGMIRFDGGRAMPGLPDRILLGIGGLLRATTIIAPKETWSKPIFLQNFLRQPPPGQYAVHYHAKLGYWFGERPEREDNDDRKSIVADGELSFTVTPADPVELEKVLAGYDKQFREQPGRLTVIEALLAVGDPAVIPHVERALEVIEKVDPDNQTPNPAPYFRILEPFRNREDARRVVIARLASENKTVVSYAFEWLREGAVVVGSEPLVEAIDRAVAREESLQDVVFYLHRVEIKPSPALREKFLRSLPKIEELYNVALALVVLSRWKIPRDEAIQGALDRVAENVTQRPENPFAEWMIDALLAWRIPIDTATLRVLLKPNVYTPVSVYESALAYLQTVRRDEYRELAPRVAALLKNRDERIVNAALKTLDLWGHSLTREEVEAVSNQEGEIRAAIENYIKKHPGR